MTLHFSPYILNKKDRAVKQEGVLLRISEEGFFGVADICPHPQFGDVTWKEELKSEGPLYRRARELALQDLTARREGKSLLSAQKIRNNFLITDVFVTDLNQQKFLNQTVKVKGGKDFHLLAEKLNQIKINLKLRLDFNSQLSENDFSEFIEALSPEVIGKIEYVEDPAVLSPAWREWNKKIPLASDWQKTDDISFAGFRICKPARERIPQESKNLVLTSAMDHPVGFAHGLRIAQQLAKTVSGFSTLDLYESEFNKYFEVNGDLVSFSALALKDTGIGMTEDLNKLNWVMVSEALK
jgi:O-succinylbenzoate synthase